MMGWVYRESGVSGVFVSTHFIFIKMARRVPMEERAGREERVVMAALYKYVRYPLHFGVVAIVLGWGC